MEIEYFGTGLSDGTGLSQQGHYRWTLHEDRMEHKGLGWRDLSFDPERLTHNLKKGETIYYQGGGCTVIGIAGSCTDNRPGTKSIFWIKEILSKEKMIEIIKNNAMAAKIIDAMSFKVKF